MPPIFLTLSEVLYIHNDQIKRYGGNPGIRDLGLLQSAISMPQAGFKEHFLHQDLFEMAAAYLFHITRNHPFIDGNKRTGIACALVFLELNDIEINTSEDKLVDIVIAVAEGNATKDDIANFFRQYAKT